MSWKRTTIYETKFLKVYEDTINLPNGNTHDKYSVVQFPDIIIIVATDHNNQLITLNEYKYGPNDVMREFPAGHMEAGEDPITAAQRELLEETGFGNGTFELIGEIREFPTKNISTTYVVRAKNIEKIAPQNLDKNESLEVIIISFNTLKQEIADKKWKDAKPLAAISLTGILNP